MIKKIFPLAIKEIRNVFYILGKVSVFRLLTAESVITPIYTTRTKRTRTVD